MPAKRRFLLLWAVGSCLILASFASAVSWLWSAAEESRAASLEREVVSALADDLAEGNLLKLGLTLSRLKGEGHLRHAAILHLRAGTPHETVFRTPGFDPAEYEPFSGFRCGEGRRVLRLPGGGVGLITALPSRIAGVDCAALNLSSDLPAELARFKDRLIASFVALIIAVFALFSWAIAAWQQRATDLEVARRTLLLEKESAVGRMASQVAHDIRSPLAALDAVVRDLSGFPEDKRIVIRGALARIRDIANHLVEVHRGSPSDRPEDETAHGRPSEPSAELLSSQIEPLVTEKRLQFRSRLGIEIEARLGACAYGLFARVQPVEFKRLLSNLIDNSVEAVGDKGLVTVSLSSRDERIVLEVRDDGKGIPPEVLARLGDRGATFGKSGGSGLGLHHAKSSVEGWGGSLAIDSRAGQGTTVTVLLPKAEPPKWFVSRLELEPRSTVVVLDDDTSIHQIWQGRFESARVLPHGVEVLHFSTPDELRGWVRGSPSAKGPGTLYLADFELLGHTETGLSLAEELGIGPRTVLVTSRFEEKGILEGCERLGARLIPKDLAGFVPISMAQPGPAAEAALLDDDALVHMTWRIAAESKGVRLHAFRTPAELEAGLDGLPKDVPVYIDSGLGGGVRGEEVAKGLHARGFTSLFLTTGHAPDSFPPMPWIKAVLGKEPPWADA